jgi:endonuclease G
VKPVATPTLTVPSSGAVWTIPLEISIRISQPQAPPDQSAIVPPARSDASPDDQSKLPEEEAVSIDPDYSNRRGYDADFLGRGRRSVPLPELSREMKTKAAVNTDAGDDEDPHVLPYHHYSVVMNGRRKLAYYTAVNIDGKRSYRIARERDKWYYDPRIPRVQQAGNRIYSSNPLDRGHLVRRLDPAWGNDERIAEVANDDTFHFTNCSPQHQDFNRDKTTWGGLENYILDNAIAEDFKVSVFTGPVLDDDRDQQYRGVQLPRQFWKVVVMAREGGKLSATAYLLSQKRLIRDLGPEALEAFEYGDYENFQVPVSKVEQLTGLDFGKLRSCDPLEGRESFGFEGLNVQELASHEDIIF